MSILLACNVGGQSVQTVNDAVIQDSIPCAGEATSGATRIEQSEVIAARSPQAT
jgi:hypothetical protein